MTVPNDKERSAGDHGGEYADEAKKGSGSETPAREPVRKEKPRK